MLKTSSFWCVLCSGPVRGMHIIHYYFHRSCPFIFPASAWLCGGCIAGAMVSASRAYLPAHRNTCLGNPCQELDLLYWADTFGAGIDSDSDF